MKTNLLASCILILAATTASMADEPKPAPAGEPLRVVLTFDDAVKEHATIAAPLLAEFGYPASFNIVTDYIGKLDNSLNWDDVRMLAKAGHDIVSHTCSHKLLTKMLAEGKVDDFRHEILDSVAAIESNANIRVTHICLPGNHWNKDVQRAIENLGFSVHEFRRPNIGGGDGVTLSAREQARAAIRKAVDDKRGRLALMFHGIEKFGWRPFPNGAADLRSVFEELRELEKSGAIKVVPYAEAYPRILRSPLVPFGAQSGRPTEADVIRTLEDAKKAGYSEFMVYPRSGLEYEYMGEEWLALVGQYLKHAERLGMGIWLYDEFNWPSGSCKGKVTEGHPEFRNTTCALYAKDDGSFDWRYFRAPATSPNVFNVAAMDRFRELTHKVYEKRFRRYFGSTIRGIFSDEPGSEQWMAHPDKGFVTSFRWYPDLEKDYRAETGRDFRADVESYCRDKSKDKFWEDYTAVMGHAFRRAFIDPITAWCDRLGIVSTGHLMNESGPLAAAVSNGLTLHVLKGFSYPAVDEIFTRVGVDKTEWLTFASAEHAIARRGSGGAAELFALGPCDLAFDKMMQMIWFAAMHKVDTYFMSLHHQTSRGFVEKPHYSMFQSPVQPWFFMQDGFHAAAREASAFARMPFAYDVAVRYRECAAGRLSATRGGDMPLPALLRELETRQLSVNLLEEDEKCDQALVLDFDGATIVANDGTRFDSPENAAEFVAAKCGSIPLAYEGGKLARDVVARRYKDGTIAILNLLDNDRALILRNSGANISFRLAGRGTWLYRPVTSNWNISLDRPNRRRIRFLADGTAKITLDTPMKVRFATCAIPAAAAKVTMDGKPLVGTKPCTFLGFGYDCDYLETEYMELAAGEHSFTGEGREDRGLFLPLLWMEGDFAANDSNELTPVPANITCGPLASAGLGDFAGSVTYSTEVEVPETAEAIVLETGRSLASVKLGGRDLGTRLMAPWRYSIPNDMRGKKAKLEITLTTSVRPMFGKESDDIKGALPSNKPNWVQTIPGETPGLLDARWGE